MPPVQSSDEIIIDGEHMVVPVRVFISVSARVIERASLDTSRDVRHTVRENVAQKNRC